MHLPLYLIAKKTLVGGRRLPKIEKRNPIARIPVRTVGMREQLPSTYRGVPLHPESQSSMFDTCSSNEGSVYNEALDFRYWEFRFWSVENHCNNPSVAVCRACDNLEISKDGRVEHHKKHGCTTTLINAYRLLNKDKDKKCVMCDKSTFSSKFGVPLCYQGTCLSRWYSSNCPDPLSEALRLSAIGAK
jgi:hypothetical protein